MVEVVLWKPLYYASIGMFMLSLLLFPFSQAWSVITAFVLISVWSKVPGYIHFVFNKLSLNDLFTFIVAAYAGPLEGGLFGVFTMLFGRIFGVNEYLPYTFRASVALFIAGISTPFIVSITGGINVTALFLFEGVMYMAYYALVVLFFRDEIGLEIGLLPAVVFFDFFLNAAWLGSFGHAFDSLMTGGISSGWTFMAVAGIVLGFAAIANNGKKIAGYLQTMMGKSVSTVAARTYCGKCLTVFDQSMDSIEPITKILKCDEHCKGGDVWG